MSITSRIASAQCFSEPIPVVIAQTLNPPPGPFPLVGCVHPIQPSPCVNPAAPTVTSLSLTTEASLEATRPQDTTGDGTADEFDEAAWYAEYFDTTSSPAVWREIWRKFSKNSKANRTTSGSNWTVKLGATGLVAGATHRFFVGYCKTNETQKGCSCKSDPSSNFVAASSFPTEKPTPPVNTVQRVEDNFNRPYTTTPKYVSSTDRDGDGLGADGVWLDGYYSGNSAGNGSYVEKPASGATYAVLPQGAVATWTGSIALNEHSYAEVKFQLAPGQADGYNFDVRTREHSVASGKRSYVAKLHWKHFEIGANDPPRLSILRSNLTAPSPSNERIAYINFGTNYTAAQGDYYTYCHAATCRCWPEIQVPAVEGRPIRPVWLRAEAEDAGATPDYPVVTATVAWDDDAHPCTGGIDTCPYRCTVSIHDDTTLGKLFAGEAGTYGMDAHEGTYQVGKIRAGSE